MLDNQIKILGGFITQGDLTYTEGYFKGIITSPDQKSVIELKFSEDCIQSIQILQFIKIGIFSKDAYFSITLTDGRKLTFKSNDRTYKRIYEKSLSSKQTETHIETIKTDINTQPISTRRMIGSILIMIAVFWFFIELFSSDPKTEVKSDKTSESKPTLTESSYASVATASEKANIYSPQKLCKAAISAEFFTPVQNIKESKTGKINELYYYRASDGSKWRYACRVDDNRIVWAGIDVYQEGNNDIGRWRDNYESGDTSITYSVNPSNNQLLINLTHSDGSSEQKTFNFSDFKKQ